MESKSKIRRTPLMRLSLIEIERNQRLSLMHLIELTGSTPRSQHITCLKLKRMGLIDIDRTEGLHYTATQQLPNGERA